MAFTPNFTVITLYESQVINEEVRYKDPSKLNVLKIPLASIGGIRICNNHLKKNDTNLAVLNELSSQIVFSSG